MITKLFRYLKRWFLWDFGRNSIPYEIVCVIYIGLLVFLPVNSNGWVNDNSKIELQDKTTITFHRDGTLLYVSWDDGETPDISILNSYIKERFGSDTVLLQDAKIGSNAMKIMPGGWEWKNVLP